MKTACCKQPKDNGCCWVLRNHAVMLLAQLPQPCSHTPFSTLPASLCCDAY
jgi:hypothetical protein